MYNFIKIFIDLFQIIHSDNYSFYDIQLNKDVDLRLIHFNFLILGIPYITDCVMGELEKLGSKYRVALRYNIQVH